MPCKIYYFSLTDEQTKTEKLEWFAKTKIQDIDFQLIKPDKNANWINLADENNGFDDLIPLITKEKTEQQIFAFSSLGVSTNRDEWVYDFSKENLERKVHFFIETYNNELEKEKSMLVAEKQEKYGNKEILEDSEWNANIKWSEYLKGIFKRKQKLSFDKRLLIKANYRPFTNKFYYGEKSLSDRLTQNHYEIFGNDLDKEIFLIGILAGNRLNFCLTITNSIPNLASFSLDPARWLPLYRYSNGERQENITDWALALFKDKYGSAVAASPADALLAENKLLAGFATTAKVIEKTDIFHYVYAVLHKPEYRQKYEQNLKREFPRIPLYDDFWKYAAAGKKLMELHLNYELVMTNDKYQLLLERKDIDLEGFKSKKQGRKKQVSQAEQEKEVTEVSGTFTVYPILKIKDNNVEIDELTTLCGVPAQALAYKLGNRSAIEWILDQYKPYKSDDKTIQEQFNNYNFADYKEEVIELLQKVCWVSLETMKIVGEL
jgi:predicted helicase